MINRKIKNKKKIFISGHNGMVGSAILRILNSKQDLIIITEDKVKLNLLDQTKVQDYFSDQKFDQVFMAAAKVGGIYANDTYPAEFIYENIMIQMNIIHSSYLSGVKKLLFLGSSCIYPKNTKQPMKEDCLLSGSLEKTNEPYAIAKIAGIKMCESYNRQYGTDYRSVMPTNLYGVGDNYNPNNSHVIPGLIRRIHEAKIYNKDEVIVWGSGLPKREFLYVDDMASACVHIMNIKYEHYASVIQPMLSHINIGSDEEISIIDLANLISEVVGFSGKIITDKSKPDGPMRKLIDSSKLKSLGWSPDYNLNTGLRKTYQDFLNNYKRI